MTADDLLFEPFNGPTIGSAASSPVPQSNGIIEMPDNFVRVDVLRSQPKQLYLDIAVAVMDKAVKEHPRMYDVRISKHLLPHGFLTLTELVGRFHDGEDEVWITRPQHMSPQLFKFEGRFGYFKFMRMPQSLVPSQTIFWFWVDTDFGQLAGIDLGLLMMQTKHYHMFANKHYADAYFTS